METIETNTKKREDGMGHWAPYYDATVWLMSCGREKAIRKETIKLAFLKSGDRILEVGCGTGSLTIEAKKAAGPSGEVQGIDAAPEMIEVARKKALKAGLDIGFKVGLMEQIPFDDDYFDGVLCSFMIFHMSCDSRRKGFGEIYRTLKPNGTLLIVDIEPPSNPFLKGILTLVLSNRMLQHGVSELKPLMRNAGLQSIERGISQFKMLGYMRGKKRG